MSDVTNRGADEAGVEAPNDVTANAPGVADVGAVLARSLAENADLPEPELPPITQVEIHDGDDVVAVSHRDSAATSGEPGQRESDDDDRPSFVLVHGLGGSLVNWEPSWPFLVEHGRVLAPDLAGFGRTRGAHRSAVGDNVRLLAAYIEQLGLERVVLVGNSMGGMIAAMLAAEQPQLVDRLVLVDPVLPLDPRSRPHWSVLATFTLYMCPPAARFVVPRYVQRRGIDRMGVEGVLTVVADPRRVPRWVMRRAVDEARALAEVQDAVPALVRAAQSIVVAAASPRYRSALHRITVPVTLLHGSRDALVPVTSARRAAAAHPAWRYVEGDGVGHVPMAEAAAWVAAEMLAPGASSGGAGR